MHSFNHFEQDYDKIVLGSNEIRLYGGILAIWMVYLKRVSMVVNCRLDKGDSRACLYADSKLHEKSEAMWSYVMIPSNHRRMTQQGIRCGIIHKILCHCLRKVNLDFDFVVLSLCAISLCQTYYVKRKLSPAGV